MTLPQLKADGPALEAEDHDRNMLFLSGFPSLAAMMADTVRGYGFYEAGQGIYVLREGYRYLVAASGASDHHLITAAGLKLYVVPGEDGIYNFKAFNPAANGLTDDYAKLMTALGAVETGEAPNKVGPTIFFPKGVYRFNTTVELHNRVTLLGAGAQDLGTVFVFPQGTHGFVVNAFNTGEGTAISEEDATTAELSTAGGSTFARILFCGAGSVTGKPSARANVDGIWFRAPATMIDCRVWGWPGAGIRIEAWAPEDKPSNPELWGDATGWYLETTAGNVCGKSPLRVRGTRASGGKATICNFTTNGWWGFDDHSFGTNVYLGCHSATNGIGTSAVNALSTPRSGCKVYHEGAIWRASAVFGEDGDPDPDHLQALVDTEPGDDSTVWEFFTTKGAIASTTIPAWVAGQSPGRYFPGGGYKISNPAAGHAVIGCYSEDDDGGGQYYSGANLYAAGGIQTHMHIGSSYMIGASGIIQPNGGMKLGTDDLIVKLADDITTRRGISTFRGESVWNFFHQNDSREVHVGQDGEEPAFQITGPYIGAWGHTYDFGLTGTPVGIRNVLHTPTIAIGEEDGARRQTRMTAAPTTGEWAQGDIVWNRDPTAGGNAAWICTSGGTPGTWKTCLPIAE